MLGLVALGIAAESVSRLLAPRPIAFDEATIIAVVGLLVNIASAVLLEGGHHHGHGPGHHDHDRAGHYDVPGLATLWTA